jgi:poly(hydroxyalkanoate) depolymerase family esterase
MNNRIDHIPQDGMAEALRLTRAGRLIEATVLIQRILGGELHKSDPSASCDSTSEPSEAIEAEYRIHEEKASSSDTSARSTVRGDAKPAAGYPAGPLLERWKVPEGRRSTRKRKVAPEEPLSSVRARGRFINGSFTNAAGTRAYKLYMPSAYAGQPLPLVVMLHGCTQSPADFAAGTRMNVLAEKEQFFVVYPEQSKNANDSKCWNWFETANQKRGAGEPSLIAGITHKIMGAYRVSVERVYVVGMSAGGAMATIMAVTYPELYAAAGVHSGLPYGAARDLPSGFKAMHKGVPRRKQKLRRVIPLIIFHGDHDTTVAKVNADHMRYQWLQAFENGGRPAGESRVERGMVGGHAYTRFTYPDTSGQVILEEWIIHQAGHAWSGGSSNGSFTDPKGPDASAEIIRFLRKHSNLVPLRDCPASIG